MTAKEAIKNIKGLLDGCCGPELDDTREAFGMAIKALEKQMPKKPTMPLDAYWVCPVCRSKLFHPFPHCARCGQAIDWTEGE